eukprot:scaffold3450_cov114-Cylindrotheca_fusiformis.AAC.31
MSCYLEPSNEKLQNPDTKIKKDDQTRIQSYVSNGYLPKMENWTPALSQLTFCAVKTSNHLHFIVLGEQTSLNIL